MQHRIAVQTGFVVPGNVSLANETFVGRKECEIGGTAVTLGNKI